MNFTRPVNARTAPIKKGGWVRKLLLICLGILTLVVLLALATPFLLSVTPIRGFVLSKINATIAPATLDVKDWSLTWFGRQRIEGIAYVDDVKGVRVTVKTMGLGSLWSLLPIGHITANVTVESPDLLISTGMPPPPSPSERESATVVATPKDTFMLPAWNLSAHLAVTDASVRLASIPEPLITKGALEVTLPTLNSDIAVKATALVLDATVSTEATLPPLPLLTAANRATDLFRTAMFNLGAPWATLTVTATSKERLPFPEIALKLSLDLPTALARAQKLGIAAPGLNVTSGSMTLDAGLTKGKTGNLPRMTAGLVSRNVVSTYEGKTLKLSPKLDLAVEFDPAAPFSAQIEKLSLDLPGFIASGHGSLETGALSAHLDVNALLETFRPFVGEITLDNPLTLRLDAKAANGTFGLEAKGSSGRNELGSVSLKAEGLNLAAKDVRIAKLGVRVNLAKTAEFLGATQLKACKGDIYLNATAAGPLDALEGTLVFALRNAVLKATSWNIVEPMLLDGSCAFSLARDKLSVKGLNIMTPALTLSGDAGYIPGKPLGQALTAKLSGVATPGHIFSTWRVWGKDELPMALDGSVMLGLEATPCNEGMLPVLTLTAESKDLSMTLKEYPVIALPLKLDVMAKDTISGDLELSRFALTTPYIEADATGALAKKGTHVSLNGHLTPDFAKLWGLPFFTQYRTAGFSVNGRHTRTFHFSAPIDHGVDGILNYGEGRAEVVFDRVTVPALDIPGGGTVLTLSEGVAALDGKMSVNGGMANLTPRVNLISRPYVLTLPDDMRLLDGVALTQDMLDSALKFVNPLLPGSATPQGTVDLTCKHFRMALDDNPVANMEAAFTLLTHGCSIMPNGTLGTLLALIHLRDKSAILPDQNFTVNISRGLLTCDPIHLRIAAVKLECRGSTNLLTQQLDYVVDLPLTQQLLGNRLSKRLRVGDTLRLPIRGSVNKPMLDTGALMETLAESAIGKATDRLTNKLSERLEKTLSKTGEAGLEVSGAAGDVIKEAARTVGEGGNEAKDSLNRALQKLLQRKK